MPEQTLSDLHKKQEHDLIVELIHQEIENDGTYYYDLEDFASLIDRINEIKGWNEGERTEGEWAALAHSEISEAFESYRDGEALIYVSSTGKPEGAAIEYVDAMIRILHWFKRHGVDPRKAMQMKIEYNLTRPYRHGGKKA